MPASTRELNVKVIFVVTIVAVMLLASIIFAAQAGYFYFKNQQEDRQYAKGAQRTFEETGLRMDNRDLAKLKTQQLADLHREGTVELTDLEGKVTGQVEMMPIDQAMQQIAERY